jgi:hypothetical protein
MMFMYQDEFKRFIDTEEKPTERRPCLACLRDTFVSYLTTCRIMKQEPDCDTSYNIRQDVDIIPQLFTNLVDCENGYLKNHMVYSQNNVDDPLIQGIVRLQLGYLFVERDRWDSTRVS